VVRSGGFEVVEGEILGLAWIEVESEERLCGGMLCFFVGRGISGEAFS